MRDEKNGVSVRRVLDGKRIDAVIEPHVLALLSPERLGGEKDVAEVCCLLEIQIVRIGFYDASDGRLKKRPFVCDKKSGEGSHLVVSLGGAK